jgi:hypothetical protein
MDEVRIRMTVGAVRLEFRGSRGFFEQHVEPLAHAAYARLDGGRPAPAAPAKDARPAARSPDAAGPAPFQPSSPPQFRRFTSQVGRRAADADQRIMAFGFYLWNFERQDEFAEEQIAAFFRTVLDDPPPDLGSRLAGLRDGKRFLESGEDPATWKLTTKGVNYVKNRLLAGD